MYVICYIYIYIYIYIYMLYVICYVCYSYFLKNVFLVLHFSLSRLILNIYIYHRICVFCVI